MDSQSMNTRKRNREGLLADFKQALRSASHVYGMQHNSGSEAIVELLGFAGFDFIMFDMEHSSYSFGDVERLIRVAEGADVVPVVRVQRNDPSLIAQALDAGAAGVVVPHIESALACRRAIDAMKYPPHGARGKTAGCRAARWGMSRWDEYEAWANQETLFIPLVETVTGVDALEEIAAVEGVSMIFIGPGDLSHSYGMPGLGLRAEPVMRAVQRAVTIGRPRGLPICTVPVPDMDAVLTQQLLDMGVRVIIWGVDLVLIGSQFRRLAEVIPRQTVQG
jgi:4-hydroxy-2-oxoheptanedioate aldolase